MGEKSELKSRYLLIGMAAALGISRQAIQKHIANLKSAGRLCCVGPDKGGHWEVNQ